MKLDKLNWVYFSPTGSTKRIMEGFEGLFKEPYSEYDITVEGKTQEYGAGDLVWFGVPSYGGRVPEAAAGRISLMTGRDTPVILLVTYGNRDFDDTLLELKELVENRGFVVIAALAAVTEHSIMHQFATGRPDGEDSKELAGYAMTAYKRVRELETPVSISVPGNKPFREYGGVPLKPGAGRTCMSCGLCAELCPVQAISQEKPRETDAEKCISCMRCIAVCPQNARSVNKLMLMAAGQKMKKGCSGKKKNGLFM